MPFQKENTSFAEEFDWGQYSVYRPKYPASVETLILDYHRTHSNSFRLAYDIGSGSGIFAVRLAEWFQHVHVSDVSAPVVQRARENLDKWYAANCDKGSFTFSVTPAEKADEVVVKGSVDLVTLMTCIHWTERDVVVERVARALKPEGTLAIVQLSVKLYVVGNERVAEAVDRLIGFAGKQYAERFGEEGSMWGDRYLPQVNAGVQCVSLPESVYDVGATRRIDINLRGRGKTPFAFPGYEYATLASRADPRERREEYTSDDPEGDGWRYEVDAGWFRGYISTVEQEENLPLYEEHLQEVERLVRETTTEGKVVIEWPVGVLLATRRGHKVV